MNAADILDQADNTSTHFKDITTTHSPTHAPVTPQPMPKWQQPPIHQFKVYIDVVTKPEKTAKGMVNQNHNGEVMASLA